MYMNHALSLPCGLHRVGDVSVNDKPLVPASPPRGL